VKSREPKSGRDLLRQAERAAGDARAEAELARSGVHLGQEEVVSAADLLEMLESAADHGPSVTVTCYFADTPVADRDELLDPLCALVENGGIGEWVGSGQGTIGHRAFFDATFAVRDLASSVAAIRQWLKQLGAGPTTEIAASDGVVHVLG
jgi:hypothetical protein